jgi:hypothetical protein
MVLRGGDRLGEMDMEPRGLEMLRPRRPWFLIVASLLLVVLVAVLWAKWSESRTEIDRLRAELKVVYMEAEAIRTQAALAQQRVGVLEKQLRGNRTTGSEGGAVLVEKPKAKVPAKSTKTRQSTR